MRTRIDDTIAPRRRYGLGNGSFKTFSVKDKKLRNVAAPDKDLLPFSGSGIFDPTAPMRRKTGMTNSGSEADCQLVGQGCWKRTGWSTFGIFQIH